MRYLAHKAAAAAFRAALEADARAEYEEQGTAPTWRVPFATVPTSVEHDGVEVVDETKVIEYLKRKHPGEVKTVVVVRNPTWLGNLLATAAERGLTSLIETDEIDKLSNPKIVDEDGEEIPGVAWRPGGAFKSISVTPTDRMRRELAKMAKLYANGEGPLEIEGLRIDE